MQQLNIDIKLDHRFPTFRERGQFVDCSIEHGNVVIKAHRIMLCYFSHWFHNYFSENKSALSVKVPFDIQNSLDSIISIIYGKSIGLSYKMLINTMKVADFYGFDSVYSVLSKKFKENFSSQPIGDILIQCKGISFTGEDKFISERVVNTYFNLDNEKKRNELISSMSISILRTFLVHEKIKQLASLSKAMIIEEFSVNNQIPDQSDRQFLERIVDLSSQSTKIFVFDHYFHWITDKSSKEILLSILSSRRNMISESMQKIRASDINPGRWGFYSWISPIHSGNVQFSLDSIPILGLSSTLGGAEQILNPINYGLVECLSNDPISKLVSYPFGINSLFENGKYYIGMDKKLDTDLFVQFDFPKSALFTISCVECDFRISGKECGKNPPKSLVFSVRSGENSQWTEVGNFNGITVSSVSAVKDFTMSRKVPCTGLRLSTSQKGGEFTVLRLSRVEIFASFEKNK